MIKLNKIGKEIIWANGIKYYFANIVYVPTYLQMPLIVNFSSKYQRQFRKLL